MGGDEREERDGEKDPDEWDYPPERQLLTQVRTVVAVLHFGVGFGGGVRLAREDRGRSEREKDQQKDRDPGHRDRPAGTRVAPPIGCIETLNGLTSVSHFSSDTPLPRKRSGAFLSS